MGRQPKRGRNTSQKQGLGDPHGNGQEEPNRGGGGVGGGGSLQTPKPLAMPPMKRRMPFRQVRWCAIGSGEVGP